MAENEPTVEEDAAMLEHLAHMMERGYELSAGAGGFRRMARLLRAQAKRIEDLEAQIADARTPPLGQIDLHKMIANLQAALAAEKARLRPAMERAWHSATQLRGLLGEPSLVGMGEVLDAIERESRGEKP